jgi:hypothetical protein
MHFDMRPSHREYGPQCTGLQLRVRSPLSLAAFTQLNIRENIQVLFKKNAEKLKYSNHMPELYSHAILGSSLLLARTCREA